ncbi:MAG: HAMP domain-containing histidine kinase [Syntrophomonadaceae bacterium]|nr:HAMP domain-containing histidine kinase [Syntrophomonadaceae bacterium]
MLVWGMASSYFIDDYMQRNIQEQLLRTGEEINQLIGLTGFGQMTRSFLRLLSSQFDGEIFLTDINGLVFASSRGSAVQFILSEEIINDIRAGKNVTRSWNIPDNEDKVITVATPIIQNDQVLGAIVLVAPVKGVEAATKAVQSQVGRASIIALILGAVISLGVAYQMTAQIREISRGTKRFAREDMDCRIRVITNDELGEAARSFNEMAERIAHNAAKRRNLLAGVSHEVRTPLTNIRGYVEALRDKVIPPDEVDRTLDLIHDEALFMERMVNDLIELSRMESEHYQLNLTGVNLSELMEKVSRKLQQLAAGKNNVITVATDPEVHIIADEVRMEQLLTNLVKNALQFTENGQVEISARREGKSVVLSVRDNGIGIDKDDIPHVFDSFYKVDPSRSKHHAESGLGLAMVQSIVKLHHGSISIDSEPGQGTTVTVTLPQDSNNVL